MRAVNLLPKTEARQSRLTKQNAPIVGGVCVGVLVAAFVGSQYMSQRGAVATARDEVAALNQTLAAIPTPPAGPTPQEQQLVGEHDARLTALTAALKNRVAWDRILREFSLVLPSDVWLTDLEVKAPVSATVAAPPAIVAGAAPPPPDGFVISGFAYSHDGVARLLARMAVLPDLDNVQLVSSTVTPMGKNDVVHFSINAGIATAPTPTGSGS